MASGSGAHGASTRWKLCDRSNTPESIGAEGNHRVDAGSPARWQITGSGRDGYEHGQHGREGDRVTGSNAEEESF